MNGNGLRKLPIGVQGFQSLRDDEGKKELFKGLAIEQLVEKDAWRPYPVFYFEFKRDGTAEEVLSQIEEKGCAAPYAADSRRLVRVGVSFDSEKRILKDWKTVE